MPKLRKMASIKAGVENLSKIKPINWYPGHMFAAMQGMIGKLNTIDCVIEVHDARIPLSGRNREFREHLGRIKPRLLLLNKRDLADLRRWHEIRDRLEQQGDHHVLLSDMTGNEFTYAERGYNELLEKVVELINNSDRSNRQTQSRLKILVTGIPNVGKSTLINRLRQMHLGKKGEVAKVGPDAGVTRNIENLIKICSRPPIYSFDTPGVLQPSRSKNPEVSMKLALCSSYRDGILNPVHPVQYLLDFFKRTNNDHYVTYYNFHDRVNTIDELKKAYNHRQLQMYHDAINEGLEGAHLSKLRQLLEDEVCWKVLRDFRKGLLGTVMLD